MQLYAFLFLSRISFRTDILGQTVQTQIRLLLEEQSDQGLHGLLFILYFDDEFLYGKISVFHFFKCLQEIFMVSKNLGKLG